jgi:mono/diheme cytochrome c family protein
MIAWKVWLTAAGALLGLASAAGAQVPIPVNLERGAAVYAANCSVCHGDQGDGKGPGWLSQMPRPQVFTNRNYMSRLTDQYLFDVTKFGKLEVVRREGRGRGYRSVGMPPFNDELNDAEIKELVSFQRTVRGSGFRSPRARKAFEEHCVPCHGPTGRGDGRLANPRGLAPGEFVSDIQPAPGDYADSQFMNRFTDDFMASLIRKGWVATMESKKFTTMAAFNGTLSDQDIWQVVGYIRQEFINGRKR